MSRKITIFKIKINKTSSEQMKFLKNDIRGKFENKKNEKNSSDMDYYKYIFIMRLIDDQLNDLDYIPTNGLVIKAKYKIPYNVKHLTNPKYLNEFDKIYAYNGVRIKYTCKEPDNPVTNFVFIMN